MMNETSMKELIEKVEELATPNIEQLKEVFYSDKKLHRIDPERDSKYSPEIIEISTLSAFVEYINHIKTDKNYVVNIVNNQNITLLTPEDEKYKSRNTLIECQNIKPRFNLDRHISIEEMIIQLFTCFYDSEDRDLLISSISSLVDETSINYEDDGVTPTVTVKTGIHTKEEKILKSIVSLSPKTNFDEIEPYFKQYLFRIQKINNKIEVALFGFFDNQKERLLINRIKDYLTVQIKNDITILC